MKLQLPFREFMSDADAHEANLRAIERYMNEPQAGAMLQDHDELPDPERWPVGSLVRSLGRFYERNEDGWVPLIPENVNDVPMQWSFTGNLAAGVPYEDTHFLDVPFDSVLVKASMHVQPAVPAGTTVTVEITDGTTIKTTLAIVGSAALPYVTRKKPMRRLSEDEELYVTVLSDDAISAASVTVNLLLRQR